MQEAIPDFSQDSFSVQSNRINPISLGWLSLYRWHEEVVKGRAKELALGYSRYKYGDFSEISRFSDELQIFITDSKGKEIQEAPKNWVVVTPPFSTVEPAVKRIGDEIAGTFNIPHADFRTGSAGDRDTQYAAITDLQLRTQAKFSVQTVMNNSVLVEGKKTLVIDDMVTTGATAAYMNRVLYENYHVESVAGFCLIDLVTEDPAREEFINRFLIVSGDIESLVTVLNNPRTTFNRHTVKSLYGGDRYILDAITPRLLPSVVERLEQTRDTYYFGKEIT